MKKILISSGGTREHVDEIRVLTNISSGKLGAKIAEAFCDANYTHIETDVYMLRKKQKFETYFLKKRKNK